MTEEGKRSLVFDTSAMLKVLNREQGHEKITALLNSCKGACIASALSMHELAWCVGRRDFHAVASALSFFEEVCTFISPGEKDILASAILRLKYKHLGLSMADAMILQLGLGTGSEIVACDRAWSKVAEAKVRVI